MQPAKAEVKPATPATPERRRLHEVLPLDAPYSLHVFPSYYCNFRCAYCLHSLAPDVLAATGFRKQMMPFDICRKALDDLREFPGRLKALIFAGHGEPLMNRDIDGMVRHARENDVAERIDIVTNASLLTPEMSDRLIAAGVDRVRVSLQGVTAKKYREVSGVEIDFDRFVANIAYFHANRGSAEIHVKIIDMALDHTEQESLFRAIFSPIADSTSIEYTIPFISQLDYSQLGLEFTKCKQGHERASRICAMPFYMLVLTPGGDVVPCCSPDVPVVYGNVMEKSLSDMWNDLVKKDFLRLQLDDKDANPVCKACAVPAYGLQEGDYLDDHRAQLAARFR
jgi:radical SAM protein with 4Fe4S-binding SPASM domain